jgi:hypothetical protein
LLEITKSADADAFHFLIHPRFCQGDKPTGKGKARKSLAFSFQAFSKMPLKIGMNS